MLEKIEENVLMPELEIEEGVVEEVDEMILDNTYFIMQSLLAYKE